VRIHLALRRGSYDAGKDLLSVGATPRPIPTTDFPRDDGRPQRLLGPPVRGVDRWVEEKTPDGGTLTREVAAKSLDVRHGTGVREPITQTGDEMTTGDGDAMSADRSCPLAIAQDQCLVQDALNVGDEGGTWIIGSQESTAAQQMRAMPTSA
jgi:hypothetical protein